ncbi:exopolysaccharide biosynthesis polyprenyl glycosylphosphotransferase [Nocardioides sp. 503]|uniref:exopolysaccharide biosynthesis polyprenyl glycosylphosphotransferase n=1 Tax=Nocardioides sp. 503 TaxID=2508326 RepID=UPI00142FDB97|nr:exopolysaccharide biosynthesis polyprenyl glycosylphosphotransferase [Nocardioides sp. 503]
MAVQTSRATELVLVASLAHAARRLVSAGGLLALVGCAASTVLGSAFTARDAFLLALACTAASLALRGAAWWAAGARGVRGRPRVLVIGGDERQDAVAALERRAGPALSVISLRTGAPAAPRGQEAPGVTTVPLEEVASYAARIGACSVVVMPEAGLEPAGLRRLQWELERSRLPLCVGTPLVGVSSSRLDATDVGGVPLVRVHPVRRSGVGSLVVDLAGRCVAAVALLLTLPLLVIVGLAVRRESPGPAVFRQQRVGRDGRLFTIYKLRTMGSTPAQTPLSNDSDGVLFKMRSDPRVTPLGRWLRTYSLDELPQLLNVVLGHMRLVGPRPALPEEVARYDLDTRRRLAVQPGITGLWQVSGRSDLSWEDTVRLDLHYVDNWSPTFDLLILCRTLSAVLRHRGAY